MFVKTNKSGISQKFFLRFRPQILVPHTYLSLNPKKWNFRIFFSVTGHVPKSQKVQNSGKRYFCIFDFFSNLLYLGDTYGIYLDRTRVDLSNKLHTKGNHIHSLNQMPNSAILQHKHIQGVFFFFNDFNAKFAFVL